MDNETKLAEALQALTYGQMMGVAQQLANIAANRLGGDSEFDPLASEDWASLLHSWAETTLEEADKQGDQAA